MDFCQGQMSADFETIAISVLSSLKYENHNAELDCEIVSNSIGIVIRCRQVNGPNCNHLLPKSHFDPSFWGSFERGLIWLKWRKFVTTKNDSILISEQFKSIGELEEFLLKKYYRTPFSLPKMNLNCHPTQRIHPSQDIENNVTHDDQSTSLQTCDIWDSQETNCSLGQSSTSSTETVSLFDQLPTFKANYINSLLKDTESLAGNTAEVKSKLPSSSSLSSKSSKKFDSKNFSANKLTKKRITLLPEEKKLLEQIFSKNPYPDKRSCEHISQLLGWKLPTKVIKWFNNRRYITKHLKNVT